MARSFYEDDEVVVTTPGYNKPITPELKAQESAHGNISFIDGMGIRSIPSLEKYMNKVRLYTQEKVLIAEAEWANVTSAVKNELATVNANLDSVIKEPVLPNVIYILTFTLTGSILVNKRSLPMRFFAPTVFGIGSFAAFMPKSFEATKESVTSYEKEQFPEVYKQQSEILAELKNQKKEFCQTLTNMNRDLESKIHEGRVFVSELVKEKDD